ncbi:LTA synthase family protein [Rossellomorea marisflavi]|uniref:LTA synthase family protein n=1 Tax=Rossellomorea marisflavi TaxID=189381 RepID=UPI00064E477F|nr:LTA synthase family protein [Rossellomorea marisflavi]KMK91757.1 glycerol phosphate lipoteichoic acid synthase [Rossellomorea marisflavi]MCM2605248.1 LTA synthase family protein [Rossellomorea marisflavi]
MNFVKNFFKTQFEDLRTGKLTFFFIVVGLFWVKTYAVYVSEFELGIQNAMQHFLLFLNPLSSALLFFAIALFWKGKGRNAAFLVINFLMSFLLYANVVYYRFFNDFITVPVLLQAKTNNGLGSSALELLRPWDILYFLDFFIIISLMLFKKVKVQEKLRFRSVMALMTSAVLIFLLNLGLANIDRPELLTRSFDRNYLVKYLGMNNFTIYDVIQNSKTSAKRALADSNEVSEVENYVKANKAEPNPEYFGKAKGKNVIYISMESLQSFVIGRDLNGEEITPFLNSLIDDKEAIYFDNLFHQTGQGKTSDAEFIMENSLYPLPQGAVFMTHANNTYQSSPAILKGEGYSSAVFHGNYKTFWNRSEMYRSMGYDQFFDATYYDMSKPEEQLPYGLKDKPFFEESIPLLKSMKQPFYSKFISLSNHFPFDRHEEDTDFGQGDTKDGVVNRYFQTAHYMDEALEDFVNDLKENGLYDDTMIVLYGDHYGISENHNKAMAEVLGKEEITDFDNAQLQRVPLLILNSGAEGGVDHTYSGQIDVRPTVFHLLGIDTTDYMSFGQDMLSKEHKQIVPFRNGDVITDKYSDIKGVCYNNETGEPVDEADAKACDDASKEANKRLELSDKVVYEDLLRFYTPEGFKPINRSDYNYNNPNPKSTQESDSAQTEQ